MKNTISLLIFCILLSASNNIAQDLVHVSNAQHKINTQAPHAYFKVVLISKKKNIDGRVGTDSESIVELWIDQNKIDSYEEYGDGEIFEKGLQANISSEMSEKIYIIELIDSINIKVNYSMFFEGEEKQLWTKVYTKTPSKNWKITSCRGDCN